MIKAGIIGATGYAGSELLRLLKGHSKVHIEAVASKTYEGQPYGQVFENFRHEQALQLEAGNIEKLAGRCDVLFLALPHGIAVNEVTSEILHKTKIIDLGADFRIKDRQVYEQWYGIEHHAEELLSQAVYGLCEINREKILNARLVANPGCYTTASILALYPLLKNKMVQSDPLIIDAKSGVSGAGRGVGLGVHFDEVNENIKAYKIASHRHTPEIEEQLSYGAGKQVTLLFTPHLVPMNRGILSVCYAKPAQATSIKKIREVFQNEYQNEYFIRILSEGNYPETKWVKGSNFCDIGVALDERTNTVMVFSAIDNLFKGAAGQAVQNMNIMFGFDEKLGIDQLPVFPI